MSSKLKPDALKAGLGLTPKPSAVPPRDRFSDADRAASEDAIGQSAQNRSLEARPAEPAKPAAGSGRVYVPGMQVDVGEKYLVPLKYVADNPNNPREFYRRDALQKLADSIRREGQLTPAQAYAPTKENPFFVLREGHSRKKALASLGEESLILEVVRHAATPMEDYRQAREINKQRDDLSVFDDAARFQKLLDSGVVRTQEELALAVRESPEYVSKVINIGKMPPLLLQRMADAPDYRFGMTLANYVRLYYELKDEASAHKLVAKILDARLSVRQVEQILQAERAAAAAGDKTAAKPAQRLRPLTRAVFNGAGEGELKYFPDGRFELNISVKDEQVRRPVFNQVIEALKSVGIDVVAGVET